MVITMADGNRHDSPLGLATLYRGREIFGLPIQTATLDAAHDVIGYYRLATLRWDMALVMPLNQRNQDHSRFAGSIRLDGSIPICPAGRPMTRWGFCPDRLRIKWRCPLAAATKTPDVTTCPHFGQDCSGSAYGRVVYTYPRTTIACTPASPGTATFGNFMLTLAPALNAQSSASTTFISSRPALLAATDGSSASLSRPCVSTSTPGYTMPPDDSLNT
ncbi:hypothetical protein KFU94_08605 [Chloroflexi bacterium TSY]|nr:hypothetical protein [Chloroflexi bacterium TSY]